MTEEGPRASAHAAVYTRDQLAELAGVDRTFVDRLCDLGILHSDGSERYTEGDVRRSRILSSLEAAGMPLEAVGEGVRRGVVDLGFVDDPAYSLFTGLTDETFREASVRTGIPIEVLFTIREAMGSPVPGPDDRLRHLELEVIPSVKLQLDHGVRQQVVERTLRAYGDNLRRMADIEADWWMSDVIRPVLASGGGLHEVGPRTAEFSNQLNALAGQEIVALYRGQQSTAWMRNFFQSFEEGMHAAGLYKPVERPPAICFLDLSGYTRLTEERGDAAAADLATRLSRVVNRTSGQHGGKPIKWLGDGVMFHFREPGAGVLAALEMVDGAEEAELPPAHVGLHAGPVLFQEGDYFGRTVNIASRIADYARRGEVLVTDEVVAAGGAAGVEYEPIGPVELKGLTEAIPLHIAHRTG